MDVNKLERANILAKELIPNADTLSKLDMLSVVRVGECLNGLLKGDEEFKTKFKQLVKETKQRLQKEFDEL